LFFLSAVADGFAYRRRGAACCLLSADAYGFAYTRGGTASLTHSNLAAFGHSI